MRFGLANAPATFQNMMNEIFKDLIDHGVVIYLDDILIYSRSKEDHIALTKKVLELLQEHQLALSPEKCEWHMSKVNFLGYIISENSIEMDQEKIKTVLEWKEPTTVIGSPVLSWVCEFLSSFYTEILQIDEITYRPDEEVREIRLASRMPGSI